MSIASPHARRGRPRKYEHASALDAALTTFWTKGFAGTSLDDLTSAMGMNRPSIYGAFGNKEALYAAAVEHYVRTVGRTFLEPLSRDGALADDLDAFYAAVTGVVTGKHGPLGCIVACTLPSEAETTPAARQLLAAALTQIDGAVRARLARAVEQGELARDTDLRTQAEVVVSGMLALSLRARAGASRRDLKRLARAFVATVAGRRG
ncbi:TetR/AcrR family transcriptional regulator [Candidatus Binatia bacterium]|nr:TetR/AcrR family transcriptional regulator [Candidatus Binatia bacterium]